MNSEWCRFHNHSEILTENGVRQTTSRWPWPAAALCDPADVELLYRRVQGLFSWLMRIHGVPWD